MMKYENSKAWISFSFLLETQLKYYPIYCSNNNYEATIVQCSLNMIGIIY
jgi:hypothetical protein